jgi:hypothetical protein
MQILKLSFNNTFILGFFFIYPVLQYCHGVFNLLSIIAIPSLCRNNLHPDVNSHNKFIIFVFLV